MRYKRWIIAILVVLSLLFIWFYPLNPKPNLNGTWHLDYCYLEGKDVAQPELSYGFTYNSVEIVGSDMLIRTLKHGNIEAKIGILKNGNLVIRSAENPSINGTYSMSVETVDDTKTGYTYGTKTSTVELVAVDNNKAITFSKSDLISPD
ncbi:hypothetical protein ACLI09_08365 [Flavobacterium sp. RHBU_24]|uniref:hypothetical protein n=1 Tax=Flavobacterium sp. RHBU_24 TaxID=3391185 RepID=UPI0039847331